MAGFSAELALLGGGTDKFERGVLQKCKWMYNVYYNLEKRSLLVPLRKQLYFMPCVSKSNWLYLFTCLIFLKLSFFYFSDYLLPFKPTFSRGLIPFSNEYFTSFICILFSSAWRCSVNISYSAMVTPLLDDWLCELKSLVPRERCQTIIYDASV